MSYNERKDFEIQQCAVANRIEICKRNCVKIQVSIQLKNPAINLCVRSISLMKFNPLFNIV